MHVTQLLYVPLLQLNEALTLHLVSNLKLTYNKCCPHIMVFSATKLYHWKELTTTLSNVNQFNEKNPQMHLVSYIYEEMDVSPPPLPRCKNWAPGCSSSELGLCRSTAVQFCSPPLCLLLFCSPHTRLALCTWIKTVVCEPYHTMSLCLIPSIVGAQFATLSLL